VITLPSPPNGDPYLSRLVAMLRADWEPMIVYLLGWRHDGTDLHLRFRPGVAVQWVQVHIQSSETGDGGATYDPDASVSSTEVDCRETRVQDVSVPDLRAGRYWVWLIPVAKDEGGNTVLFDGEDDRPDYMSFLDLGV
jgi:hypothetical protein